MASSDLDALFHPESIALVGASADPEKLAGRPLRYLEAHGYGGELHLVNPSHEEIGGRPCHDSVTAVGPVDLALVLVPAAATPGVVRECGDAGVDVAVVIASGFEEAGNDDLERRLLEAAREGGVRLVGPNSEGAVTVPDVAASFSSILKREELLAGGLSFVTQSGAFGGALFQLTQDLGVGASKWLSTGNEADVTTVEVLEYLVEDPGTEAVVAYVEALSDGERLPAIGRRAAETGTPIVAMRVGRSDRGREAAASHTGSVATDDAVYDALFEQSGVTRVGSVDAFTDAVVALSRVDARRYPRSDPDAGVGLGVVSISGGAAGLIADACEDAGLAMAAFGEGTVAALRERIPPYGSPTNPVDVTGAAISDPSVFESCLRAVAEDDAVTALLLQFGNSGRETIEACKAVLFDIRESIPVAAVFTGGRPRAATREELAEAGVLYFEDPVRAVGAISRLADRAAFRDRAPDLPVGGPTGERAPLPGDWAGAVGALSEHGVEFAGTVAVDSPGAAEAAAERLGYPVVVKYSPLDVTHKTERDGVRVGLGDATAVRRAYADLAGAGGHEVLVQRAVEGVEALVGVVDDPDFGPVMTVGPGGTLVELFDEFAYRGLPVTRDVAAEMIAETPLDRLLSGVRGRPPGDREALAARVAALSDAYRAHDVTELELNPVVVTPEDALAVDLLAA